MKQLFQAFADNWIGFAIPFGVLSAVLASGYFGKRALFRFLENWAGRTGSRIHAIAIDALRGPFMIWVLIAALHLATLVAPIPARFASYVSNLLLALWILSLTVAGARLAARIVRVYGNHIQSELPVTSLTENVARIIVVLAGTLTILRTLGIEITPVLTALGVGGLAVALALQDTLANFFAGFYVSIANQIRTGDYIRLDSGEEGFVSDINWRNTTVRTLPNNLIIVPNSKLSQAIVTNYHLPERRMSVSVNVSVSSECDPEEIERLLADEARIGAGRIPGLLAEPAPVVRFNGFGASSLDFTLSCQVAQFVDQYAVQHELRKRIFKRFRANGVPMSAPVPAVYVRGAGPGPAVSYLTRNAAAGQR